MSRGTRWIIVAIVAIGLVWLAVWQVNQRAAALERVHDLTQIDQLKATFNRDAGAPRLIVLVSPT